MPVTTPIAPTAPAAPIASARPSFHFAPAAGWINDPNGLIYLDGEYHLFYQHNPAATVWGPMHWGHAVSRDLITWQELPIALAPDSIGVIFSGSAILDQNNTAGFGSGAMVAIFTQDTTRSDQKQVQSLAYSTDHGRTWIKYSGNPVLVPPEGNKDFRDPKVFWYTPAADRGGGFWVMALAVGREIWFYRSANLKDWTLSSRFGARAGSHGGVWECPELVQLSIAGTSEKRWVLIVSVGDGAPAGGSGVQYFVGQFDGQVFMLQDAFERVRWADFGADFYAPQAWNNTADGRTLILGWMNNWSYANQVPDTGGWRGSMSVARELSLRREGQDLVLVQQPVRELDERRKVCLAWTVPNIVSGTLKLGESCNAPPTDLARWLDVTFRMDSATTAPYFGLRMRSGAEGASMLEIGYNVQHKALIINRRGAGPTIPAFSVPQLAPLTPRSGRISLRILMDQSSLEVLADDGRMVMTEQIYPSAGARSFALFADDGAVTVDNLALYHLGAE